MSENFNNINFNNADEVEYLSREGFDKLKSELAHLKDVKRKEVAKRLEYAKSLGDLSENSEYQEAKEMQESNEMRIAELEDILGRTVLITKSKSPIVIIGSTVVVRKKGDAGSESYNIVGSEEADPTKQKISNESPIGKAFLGRKKGEVVTVSIPRGATEYVIMDIL